MGRVDPWDNGFVDLDGEQDLLGQRRAASALRSSHGCRSRSTVFREAIEYVAIDRVAAYASAIRTPDLMPNATIVVDYLHMVKLANDALTKVRRRVTWDLHDRRGPKYRPRVGQPARPTDGSGALIGPRASTSRRTQSGPRTPAPRS